MDRTITEVSHLAQLRKSDLHIKSKTAERDVRAALAKTEHFVFTAIAQADEEVRASVEAMQEADVWRLPYPVCTFEYTATLNIDGKAAFDGVAFRMISLCVETDKGPGTVVTFVRSDAANPRSWRAIFHREGTLEFGEAYADGYAAGVDDAFQMATPVQLEDAGMCRDSRSVGDILSGCLVALATRGIRRERWCGDKKVLVGRKEPSNTYTRVMVAEAAEAGHGHTAPGERYKVRLHLRRGHIRHQPHGPGRRFTRRIWIEPCLVGYVEEGEVRHDHYEAYPTHAEGVPA